MGNLLLITDVDRLRKLFGQLAADNGIRLRIASNLESGAAEIFRECPDLIFVQAHLSGLSPDILITHLKKQIGETPANFVLLATPGQANEASLAQYHDWLDTSADDGVLIENIKLLLEPLINRSRKNRPDLQPSAGGDSSPRSVAPAPESLSDILSLPITAVGQAHSPEAGRPLSGAPAETASLEEQGITYSPRQRIKVQSEFNYSFDNAVSQTREPSFVDAPVQLSDLTGYEVPVSAKKKARPRSKLFSFMLWLAPVVIAVVVATILQHRSVMPTIPIPAMVGKIAGTSAKAPPPRQAQHSSAQRPGPLTAQISSARKAPVATAQDATTQNSDKVIISAITESNAKARKAASANSAPGRLTGLPDFIPRKNIDKSYSAKNPGWERYLAGEVDYRVYRDKEYIKAIQIIALNGTDISKVLLERILVQLTPKPAFVISARETREGFRIERGKIAENIKAVYYRDAQEGQKLQALAFSWD